MEIKNENEVFTKKIIVIETKKEWEILKRISMMNINDFSSLLEDNQITKNECKEFLKQIQSL